MRKKIFAVIAIIAGTCAGLVLAKLIFRNFENADDTAIIRAADPFLHHTLRPNASGMLRWGTYIVPYFTNSLGYRDASCREIQKKSSRHRRILILGDSFAEGMGMPYPQTAAGYLQSEFNKKGISVEVLNGAVASYSPFLEYRKLKRFFEDGFQTDEVVLFLDISDVQDEATAGYERLGENENFQLPNRFVNLFREIFFGRQFWETITFANSKERIRYYSVRGQWTENQQLLEEFGKRGIQRCEQNLLRIRDLTRSHGAGFTLVLYPWIIQIRSPRNPSLYETTFGDFARSENIHVLNLVPVFRSATNWQQYFLRGDVHWNQRGNSLVAENLLRDLES